MVAFAGNSVICRMALTGDAIDPASFTSVRIAAGAVALLVILALKSRAWPARGHGSWMSALTLFLYAVFFSYAYLSLSAGTGALILFGFVQGTMIVMALISGDRPNVAEWLGWAMASAGLVWLLLPGIESPSPVGAAFMAIAGVAWGVYSIRGRHETDALAATTNNFVLSHAFVVVLTAFTFRQATLSGTGVLLACISGALTSGVGYVVWYAALNYMSAMQAALVQLSVPAIAAAGGVLLLAEIVTVRLFVSATLILGGISLAIVRRSQRAEAA